VSGFQHWGVSIWSFRLQYRALAGLDGRSNLAKSYICKNNHTADRFTLGKDERLKSRKLIDRVFREGKSFALFPFRVYYISLPPLPPRGASSKGAPLTDADAARGIAAASVDAAPGVAASAETVAASGIAVPADNTAGPAVAAAAGTVAKPGARRLQAGFGASSRNFKKAVDRNRIKRLTREAYRLQKHTLQAWLQEKDRHLTLFFIYTGKELPGYEVVKEKIGLALQKLMKEPGS